MKLHLTIKEIYPAIITGIAILAALFINNGSHTRQYKAESRLQEAGDRDAGAGGMEKFFFNARKNPFTNQMDYAAMLNTEQQVAKMRNAHRPAGALGLNWRSLGPGNIGGRTRAILIDKNDPSGNTVFAGGVSGGLWKSTNAGDTWDSINDNLANLCIGCIAQDANGNIFIGTGEGFSLYEYGMAYSTAMLGGGIFESTDDGKTFNILPATQPSATNNDGVAWAYTNRIAIQPNNPNVIYAATNRGLEVSTNGGSSFTAATNSSNGLSLTQDALDVKISTAGDLIVACVNGNAFYCYPSASNSYEATAFTEMHQSGYGSIQSSGGGRIELAISPTNSNYAYAAVVNGNDDFLGIYFTMTAVSGGNGGNWYEMGPGGSSSLNPYGDQGTYDNTIGVSPTNPGLAYFGGTRLWSWQQANASDTTGNWVEVSHYFPYYTGDPLYVHPDMHTIVFDPANSNVMYIGCDGGVYQSFNAGTSWLAENRNYDVTQFYAITCAPFMNANGEGILGGTQDNGTPYVSGNYDIYYQDGVDLGGGDGGQCAISSINPNAYYVSSDGNTISRSSNLSGLGSAGDAGTATKGLLKGADYDSVLAAHQYPLGCFVPVVCLYENSYDTLTLDSLSFISQGTTAQGDTIWPISPNGNIAYPYPAPKNLVPGDTIRVQNRVVSKLATAFDPSGGVWVMMQAIDFSDPVVWMPVGGPDSKPDAFTGSTCVHCLAWSPDGDALFAGTDDGQLYRFSNLDSIVDTSFVTGGLWSEAYGGPTQVVNSKCRVISTSLTAAAGTSNQDILCIAVDPYNGNNIMVTTGAYIGGTHIYYSNNALSASPTFTGKQGTGLPEMPVYCGILHLTNSYSSTMAVVGTEHGVYTTADITAASPVWTADNTGMANTLVLAMKQQTLPAWQCNNSGNIYIGTHGRGAWVDTTYSPTSIPKITATAVKVNLSVYPNPMNTGGTLAYTLPSGIRKATVTLYDIEGRAVQEIPVETGTPGVHTVSFDTQNMNAGVYFATLSGDNFSQTTKFVVAR